MLELFKARAFFVRRQNLVEVVFAKSSDLRSRRMETPAAWKAMFEGWPDAIERKGMVVTSFGEAIPFQAFMISGSLLLLERDKPDQFGTRKVILAYDQISAVRLPTTMELARFQVMGFQPSI
jgi:hypothetical protein